MSMIYSIRQASDATIETLLAEPELIDTFLEHPSSEGDGRPGAIARLLRVVWDEGPHDVVQNNAQFDSDAEDLSLEKEWHGLHYLLTGSAWEGDPPEAFLLNWGSTIGEIDVGYGPARAFTSMETAQVNECLSSIEAATLRSRFNPKEMMDLGIYPEIWDRPPEEEDTLACLISYYEDLQAFIGRTAARGFGMVVYLS